MVKLYVHALFALLLMGTATSALESTRVHGGSVACLDGVQTGTGCHQTAWTESKSQRALRLQAEEPIDPEEPSDPEEPFEPEEPTEPFEPLDPEEPTEEPTEPLEPLDPELPAEEPPVEPDVPSEDPTDPSVPLQPLEPDAPTEEPVDSEPGDPETPAPSDMYMYSPIGPEPTEPEPTPADEPVDAATDSVDGTTSPPVATTVSPFTTAPVTVVSTPVCSAKPQKGDQLAGIDIVTDASCLSGGLGCLGTMCRYCKRSDSQTSKHLMPCESIVGTPPSPSTPPSEMPPAQTSPTQADLVCGAWLTPGDRAAGILVANDLNCGKGGVGCVDKVCRYCRAWDTPQAKHMLACSGFASVATPSNLAPSVLANGASCDSLLTTGDRAVGILVASDTNCVKGGVGCIGSLCRYCRAKDTPQSKHLMECSVLSVTATPAFTFAPLTTTTTTAPAVTGDCTNWSTSGDRSVGIFVATDATCSRGGVGCIRATACRYCRKQDTAKSHHLKECSLFSVVSPASAEAVEMEASSVTTQSFATESSGATNASSGLIVSVVGVCVAATVAVAVFTVKRFGAPKHNVEMTTPTFISHRSVSISNL